MVKSGQHRAKELPTTDSPKTIMKNEPMPPIGPTRVLPKIPPMFSDSYAAPHEGLELNVVTEYRWSAQIC